MPAGLNVQENSMRALNIYITTDQKVSRCSEYNKVLATQTITMKQILYCHLDKNSLTRSVHVTCK